MTEIVIYSAISLAIVFLAGRLVRRSARDDLLEASPGRDLARGVLDGSPLSLAERIFDPADYLWLRDKVCFSHLARILLRSRKQLALRWLKALRTSFDDVVRAPEPVSCKSSTNNAFQSWQLLWLILRFHFLLGYAMLVVRVFGPYHRLVPSLGWIGSTPDPTAEKFAPRRLI